jgi:hypothetical protein
VNALENIDLVISSTDGREIKRIKELSAGERTVLPELPAGIYFLKSISNRGTLVKRILIY